MEDERRGRARSARRRAGSGESWGRASPERGRVVPTSSAKAAQERSEPEGLPLRGSERRKRAMGANVSGFREVRARESRASSERKRMFSILISSPP